MDKFQVQMKMVAWSSDRRPDDEVRLIISVISKFIYMIKNNLKLSLFALITDEFKIFEERSSAMGMLGKIKSLSDLPDDDILIAYIQQGIQLNEDRIKLPVKPKVGIQNLIVPTYFIEALQKNPTGYAYISRFQPVQ